MVELIRQAEKSIGSGIKKVLQRENTSKIARKEFSLKISKEKTKG